MTKNQKKNWRIYIGSKSLYDRLLILKVLNDHKSLSNLIEELLDVYQSKKRVKDDIPAFLKDLKEISQVAHPSFTRDIMAKWEKIMRERDMVLDTKGGNY